MSEELEWLLENIVIPGQLLLLTGKDLEEAQRFGMKLGVHFALSNRGAFTFTPWKSEFWSNPVCAPFTTKRLILINASPNGAEAELEYLSELRKARSTDSAILLLCSRNTYGKVRGSSAFEGTSDGWMTLEKDDEQGKQRLSWTMRDRADGSMLLGDEEI